mmetsp:Transcript_34697/g.136753  ORF Transcript_34697/g.136753 Transcript_34697/m.136753 type:complete len:250 (+) Transcript_34697:1518-2267(+)
MARKSPSPSEVLARVVALERFCFNRMFSIVTRSKIVWRSRASFSQSFLAGTISISGGGSGARIGLFATDLGSAFEDGAGAGAVSVVSGLTLGSRDVSCCLLACSLRSSFCTPFSLAMSFPLSTLRAAISSAFRFSVSRSASNPASLAAIPCAAFASTTAFSSSPDFSSSTSSLRERMFALSSDSLKARSSSPALDCIPSNFAVLSLSCSSNSPNTASDSSRSALLFDSLASLSRIEDTSDLRSAIAVSR